MVDLLLDPQIRSWVVVPIVILTFLLGIARHHLTLLLKTAKPVTKTQIMEGNVLTKCRLLRMNGRFIPRKSFAMRKHFLADKTDGILVKRHRTVEAPNPMTDPTMVTEMMKNNMMHVFTFILVGAVINAVFSGFVTIRVPFPLTYQFKSMLQRGVELSTLSTSWVSSASFYFICVFGLRSVYSLILGADNQVDQQSKMMQQQMMMGGGQGNADPGKRFDAEREAIQVTEHEWALVAVEKELLQTRFR